MYRTDFRIAVLRIARIYFLRSMSEIEEQEKKKNLTFRVARKVHKCLSMV